LHGLTSWIAGISPPFYSSPNAIGHVIGIGMTKNFQKWKRYKKEKSEKGKNSKNKFNIRMQKLEKWVAGGAPPFYSSPKCNRPRHR
jgi:hypothetical protein